MVDGSGPMGIAVLLACSWAPAPGNSAGSSSITLDLQKLEGYGCAFPPISLYRATVLCVCMCMYEYGHQGTTLGIIPQVLFTFFLR